MRLTSSNRFGSGASDSEKLLKLVRMIAGENPHQSAARGFVMLLPLVRRTIQTGNGPPGLLRWIKIARMHRSTGASDEELARELTEELVRFFIGPPDPLSETCSEF